MKNNKKMLKGALSMAVVAGIYANSAMAAGPLYLFKPGQPYKYDVSTPVPVYTDQGDLCDPNIEPWWGVGCLTNEQADTVTVRAFAEWSNVETSSFKAEVKGDFGKDITGANAAEIILTDNGGGIHVMYDADSSIITDFFGAGAGVLGIASPERADENGIITESWAVMNVYAVPKSYEADPEANADESMRHTLGVFTHEFGHAINLSHSQTNGFKVSWGIDGKPGECSAAFDSNKVDYPDGWTYERYVENLGRVETMFPFITPSHTGDVQGTVNITDDKVSLSNIYPAANYKAEHGSISGRILSIDGSSELSGVNVIARNINNPYLDAVSAMSGDQTQGMVGPDGSFTINGLTPGEEYVVYVEPILAGGYPTTPIALPSLPEYFNGAGESENAAKDDPCAYTPITAVAGQEIDATIAFNGVARAPTYKTLPTTGINSVSQNGKVFAGVYDYYASISWKWDERNGFSVMNSQAAILSENGQKFVGARGMQVAPWYGGLVKPGYWDEITGWTFMDLPNTEACDGYIISPYDADAKADKVVGLGYTDGCGSYADSNRFGAVLWDNKQKNPSWKYLDTPATLFEGEPAGKGCSYDENWSPLDYCHVSGSRANAISGNGKVVVGHVDAAFWRGAAWVDGKFTVIGTDTFNGYVGSANDVSYEGTAVTGGGAGGDPLGYYEDWQNPGTMLPILDTSQAYIWNHKTGTKLIGNLPCPEWSWFCSGGAPAKGIAISDDGTTVLGEAGSFWDGFTSFIWRESLGMVDINKFFQNQGMMEAFNTTFYAGDISGDGKTFVGLGVSPQGYVGAIIKLDQVWVCHDGKSNLAGFPNGIDEHLNHGDEVGLCEADRPIQPH